MDETLQNKFREAMVEVYQKGAWEALGNYDYYGKQYQRIKNNVDEMAKKQTLANDEIAKISRSPEYHTVESKNKIKALKKDVDGYTKGIESVDAMMHKLWKEAVAWREKGVSLLEQAENFKTFKVNTPEEIEKNKEIKK